MKVYLAGPINGQCDDVCNAWRSEAKQRHDINWIDPMNRDYRGKELQHVDEIVRADKQDILGCDVLLANVNIASAGTSMEIMFAYQNGIRVVIFASDQSRFSPWHLAHSHVVVTGSVSDAMQHGLIK